jgi:hypothetical protein
MGAFFSLEFATASERDAVAALLTPSSVITFNSFISGGPSPGGGSGTVTWNTSSPTSSSYNSSSSPTGMAHYIYTNTPQFQSLNGPGSNSTGIGQGTITIA